MFSIVGGGTSLNQWDLDKKLANPHMTDGDKVLFRSASGATYILYAYTENGTVVVNVPNRLMQVANPVVVDLVDYPGCQTLYNVIPKDKPEGYTYTETDPHEPSTGGGMTAKQAKQLEQNTTAIERLSKEKADKYFLRTESVEITSAEVVENALVGGDGNTYDTEAWSCTTMLPLEFEVGEPITARCTFYGNTSGIIFYADDGSVVLAINNSNIDQYGITLSAAMQEITITPPAEATHIRLNAFKNADTGATYTSPSDFALRGQVRLDLKQLVIDTEANVDDALDIKEEVVTVSATADEIVTGAFVNRYGVEYQSESYVCTKYLHSNFKAGTPVTIRCALYAGCGFALFDKNMICLFGISGTNASDYGLANKPEAQEFSVDVPEGTKYARLSMTTSAYTAPSDFTMTGIKRTSLREDTEALADYVDARKDEITNAKVLVMGDSISVDYYGDYPKWVTHLIDVGFFNRNKTTNNSIHATGFVARYNDEENDFISRIEAISDPETYDLVVIFGGINDFIQDVPFGDSGSDKSTYFVPAVDYFFDYLINNFTQARIAVLSPLITCSTSVTSEGKSQTDYADYIKEVAKSFCLPVLNLTDESGFCPYNKAFKDMWTFTDYDGGDGVAGDGVHPNEEYQRRFLAPMIRHFLQGLM